MKEKTVEIIAQSYEDAVNAQKGGAGRVELVSALSEGGLTPSLGMVTKIIDSLDIEVAVMVRPTSRSFCYEKHFLDVMKRDAELFQEAKVKRLVIGTLDPEGAVDLEALNFVLQNISIDVTFHRAIDDSGDIIESVKALNECPKVTHILTSGGPGKAPHHLDTIREMIKASNKRIMLGSGMNLEALEEIKKRPDWEPLQYDVHFGTFAQDERGAVDPRKVQKIVNAFYN